MSERCRSCGSEVEAQDRFCSGCGRTLPGPAGDLTVTSPGSRAGLAEAPPGRPGTVSPRITGSGSAPPDAIVEGRFLPGAVLAGRYRVGGLLGRGGMGEIYRADDLKLGQQVALKFLPEALAHDPAWLARFHNEVRMARQVSHPNVCRVYDIGEVDGQHFLSMEYVDGEDLASLLRRIGRLPRDKAIQIARQLCAGLAAAHEKGVLHRDLKPANVMVDGRGQVRLTDFGIAGFAEDLREGKARAGTPAYMAPEQIAGRGITARSDIYSLGLVLYELCTGKPAFEAATFADYRSLHETAQPTTPSLLLAEIDPALERTILRCLEKDPADRPASAVLVAASLPGGDPLAAALAAGETPSPELVAAAGDRGGLRPVVAWACLVLAVAGVVGVALLARRTTLYERAGLSKAPQVLRERAREVLGKAGHDSPRTDWAEGMGTNDDVMLWLKDRDDSASRWDLLSTGRLGAVRYWYRESPRVMAPVRDLRGAVLPSDPPVDVSGMALVLLDEGGRLIELRAVPPQVAPAGTPADARAADWPALFEQAGLDVARFRPAEPDWTPTSYADERAAWTGASDALPGIPLRVEAAAFGGKPVYFRVIAPWARPERMVPPHETGTQRFAENFTSILLLGGLGAAALLARRNLRLGRGDQRGAARAALFVLATYGIQWLAFARHQPSLGGELAMFIRGSGMALFISAFVWLLYLALEPAVRRRWPHTIISWSRAVAWRLRDPQIGRDLLVGAVAGVALVLGDQLRFLAATWAGLPPQQPTAPSMELALSANRFVGSLAVLPVQSILGPMLLLFLLVGLRSIVARPWLAVGIAFLLFVPIAGFGDNFALDLPFTAAGLALQFFVLLRLGLLALAATVFFAQLLTLYPITADPSAWYWGASAAAAVVFLAVAGYGFATSLAGRPAFGPARSAPD